MNVNSKIVSRVPTQLCSFTGCKKINYTISLFFYTLYVKICPEIYVRPTRLF